MKTTNLFLRLNDGRKEKLKALAKANGLTIQSYVVDGLLEEALRNGTTFKLVKNEN